METQRQGCPVGRVLRTTEEVHQLSRDLPPLAEICNWLRDFVAKPHPNLGRTGDVCPFMSRSLRETKVWLTVVRTQTSDVAEMQEIVATFRERFLQLEPSEGDAKLSKAILILFPDVAAEDARQLIDEAQRRLKPEFVDDGLMVGEFHPLNDTPGLHNPDFRPLRSPVPMLVIRHMVESDLVFLTRQDLDPAEVRARYIKGYLRGLSHLPASRLVQANSALREAEAELAALQTVSP